MVSEHRILQLTSSPLAEGQCTVTALNGSERLNGLFEFDVTLVAGEDPVDPEKLIGEDVAVTVKHADLERLLHGVVCEVNEVDPVGDDTYEYVVRIVPRLWLLGLCAHNRIFQEASAPDIVQQVVAESCDMPIQRDLNRDYPPREICVQFGETDLDFVQRLLAEEGIAYYFKHDQGGCALVLCDSMAGLADCDPLSYPYRERNDGTWMTMVSRFKLGGRLCTARLVSTDYGENRPGHPIKADVRSKVHAKSIRHGEMALHGRHDFNPNDVRTLANGSCHDQTQRWLQGMEAGGAEFRAESGAPTLTAGHKFELEDTPVSAGDERRFLLVEVTHQALDGRDQESGYSNTFTCVATSNSTAFTPRIIPEKPRVWGPQTAEVVDINSPQGSQSHASVKVRFPWQEDETSCWARVAQLYAGPEWGSYFVPDIGQEVLVEYVNGDPDRPVIVGAVYNDSNPIPPYTDTQSGIRTRGSNYNELRFDDKRGSEEVYFQAGRDHNFLVNNDEAGEIGHDQKIEIGNDKTTEVGANVKLEAGQNIDVTSKMGSIKVQSKAGKIDIEAATGITLKVGSSSIEMTPAGITIKSTMIDVNGTMVTVKANAMAEVSSSAMLTLRGGLTRIN